MHLDPPPPWLRLLFVLRYSGGCYIVDSLLYVSLIVCGGSVFVFCMLVCITLSFLVLQSSLRGRESWLFYFNDFLVSFDC